MDRVFHAVADGVDTYRQRALTVARMDSAEGAALDHARSGSSGGGGGGRPATITRGELAALALRKVRRHVMKHKFPLFTSSTQRRESCNSLSRQAFRPSVSLSESVTSQWKRAVHLRALNEGGRRFVRCGKRR